MFPIKMTQHRPSASAVHHGKHQVTSRQARSNSLRVKTDHQVPAWQCSTKSCAAQTDAPEVRHTKLSLWIWAYWTAVHQLWQDRHSDVHWKQVPYDSALTSFQTRSQHLLNSRKHKLKSQPRCIHLLLRQRPLTRACLYDNQCWFVMSTVVFALARTVSDTSSLIPKGVSHIFLSHHVLPWYSLHSSNRR